MSENQVVQPFENKPYSMKIEKNSKGYNFEVKVYSEDKESLTKDIEELTKWAQDKYGA